MRAAQRNGYNRGENNANRNNNFNRQPNNNNRPAQNNNFNRQRKQPAQNFNQSQIAHTTIWRGRRRTTTNRPATEQQLQSASAELQFNRPNNSTAAAEPPDNAQPRNEGRPNNERPRNESHPQKGGGGEKNHEHPHGR